MSEKTPSQTAEKLHSKSQQKIPGRIDLINLPEGMRVKLQNKPLISPEQVAKEEIAVEEGIAREKSREAYIQEQIAQIEGQQEAYRRQIEALKGDGKIRKTGKKAVMWLLRSPVFWEFVLWIVVPVLLTLLVMLSIMAVMDSKFLIKTVTTLGKWGAAISVWQGMEWVKGVF